MGGKRKEKLIDAIKIAAGLGVEYLPVIRAKVESVDEEKFMIKAVDMADSGTDESPVYEASLRAAVIEGDFGKIPIPETGSTVALAFVNNSKEQAVVIACSKIAKIITNAVSEIESKINGSASGKLKITTDGVLLGAGSEPVVLGNPLKSWAQQVDSVLNTIITWGGTGLLGTGGTSDVGGIAPLTGISAPNFPDGALSEKHKAD